MGGFDPAGTPNTVCHPLGLVTTPQNTFRTSMGHSEFCVLATLACQRQQAVEARAAQQHQRLEHMLQNGSCYCGRLTGLSNTFVNLNSRNPFLPRFRCNKSTASISISLFHYLMKNQDWKAEIAPTKEAGSRCTLSTYRYCNRNCMPHSLRLECYFFAGFPHFETV